MKKAVNKVYNFIENIKNNESNIFHTDIHPRNIMKDIEGNFYLIDFDRME